MLDVATKFDGDICDMDAVFGKMSMFQIVIQETKGQITSCLFILIDDEIYDTLAHHFHVIRRCVVYDDMNALNMYSPFSSDKQPYVLMAYKVVFDCGACHFES